MTGALAGAEAALIAPIAKAPILDHTLAWAAINSGTGNLGGLSALADDVARAFSVLPGAIDLVPPAPVTAIDADGAEIAVANGHHLVVRVRPEARVRVLLTGHMDTVYGPAHPFQSCHWLDDTRLNGPGTADMKAGLALLLAGLAAFEESAPALGYDVLINSDEETGSLASAALIGELAQGKHAALTYEPAIAPDLMARARPGSGNYAAVVSGRAAHAGRNPQDGRNALVAAADLALRLAAAQRPGLSVNPARIEGGSPNNIVPAHALLRFNLRPASPDDAAEAQALVVALAAEVAAAHEVRIHVHGGMSRPPKPVTPASEALFAIVRAAAADLGQPLAWQDTGGVCDGNNVAALGVPVIDTMGAVGGLIHSADEWLDTGELVRRAALTTLVLHRIDAATRSA
jgi:glutamate carboxypeptidase